MSNEFEDAPWVVRRLGSAFLVIYFLLVMVAGCCEMIKWHEEEKELKKHNAIEQTDVEIA